MTLSELTSIEDRNLDLDNDGQPDKLVLPFYRTPPYLSAKPQVVKSPLKQTLKLSLRFVTIASVSQIVQSFWPAMVFGTF